MGKFRRKKSYIDSCRKLYDVLTREITDRILVRNEGDEKIIKSESGKNFFFISIKRKTKILFINETIYSCKTLEDIYDKVVLNLAMMRL